MLPGTACLPRWRFLFWSHNLALSLASTAGDGVSDISIGWLVQYWGCNLILIWKWNEKVKVRTLPKPLSSHYDRLDLRIDYEGQKVKVKVKVRTLPQLLFSHYERLDLRIDKGQRVDSFLRQHTIWNRLQMVGNSPTLPRPYWSGWITNHVGGNPTTTYKKKTLMMKHFFI